MAAISVALLTETFGFSSGFVGYYRKGLIDFRSAVPFIAVGVPIGILGAVIAHTVDGSFLKVSYGVLMLVLAVILIRHHGGAEDEVAPARVADASVGARDARPMRRVTDRNGVEYTYPVPKQGLGAIATGIGALLTGMVSVGIGEVVMPQLVKRNGVPVPVAAATSVLIVIIVVAASSFTLISTLIAKGGVSAVPWNIVCYTVPAVIIGGQIGPRLQGKVSHAAMERAIGGLFAVIGLAMLWIVIGPAAGGH